MVFSELRTSDLMAHAVVSEEDVDYSLLPDYLESAKSYVLGYTGLTEAQADEKPELAVAALVVAADLVKNKEATVDNSRANEVLDSFLGMHRMNLL